MVHKFDIFHNCTIRSVRVLPQDERLVRSEGKAKAMHKVFICYHHANDQYYKEQLSRLNRQYEVILDQSVDTGDVDDTLDDETIRELVRKLEHQSRDEYKLQRINMLGRQSG